MPSIILKNSDSDFDLDGFLSEQGLSLVDSTPKSALNYFRNKGNVSYRVKDQEGKEFDFDAANFLRDQGMEPDLDATYEREQKKGRALQEAEQANVDTKLRKELDEAGFGEYMAKTAAPFTSKLLESDKAGSIPRTALAVTADALSLVPRGAIGAFESAKKSFTGKGKDLDVSMGQVPTYGPEQGEPDQGAAEALGAHWEATKKAFHADPVAVTKDLLRESARDPLTGAALVAAVSSGGTLSPVLASRLGPVLAQVASKYKGVGQAASVAQRAGKALSKAQAKLEKANLATKLTAGIASEAAGGGLQGVLMNYAMGEDQDAWNTFIVEGVEEGAFGALMAPIYAGWHYLPKSQQIEALQQVREDAIANAGNTVPEVSGAYAEPQDAPLQLMPPQGRLPAPDGSVIYGPGPRFPETPDVIPMGQNPEASGPTINMPGYPKLPRPGDVPPVAVLPNKPGVTIVGGAPVSIYDDLPPGVSRDDVLKKMQDPAHVMAQEKEAEAAREKKAKAIEADVKKLKQATEKMQKEAQAAVQKSLEEAAAEVEAEEQGRDDEAAKARESVNKDIDALVDPTKETSFPTWNRLFGDAYPEMDAKTKAFEDFHVDEAKKIQKVRERIKPPAEGATPTPAAPAAEGYIEKGGQQNGQGQEQTPDPGDGGGAPRGGGEPGGAGGGEDAAGQGPGQPGDAGPAGGLEDGVRQLLSREPGKPRPVEADDQLPTPAATQKAERDTEASRDPEFRPVRGPAFANIDLRKKSPIVLTKGQRVELNQKGKEILTRVDADPTSLTEEDREVLRHYTGQGGLGVKADEEAAAGILNQHYTPYPVVKFAWDALQAAGFPMDKRRTALEPTAGIGNFIGHKPENVDFHANEVDPTSARVMGLLYPQNIVNREGPFETYFGPKVDIVVTNVPFLKDRGAYAPLETDKRYDNIKGLHNYVMMKSLDQLHDNGVGVFITSTGTMDAKTGAEFRKQFNQKGEILGAFRLPQGTFEKNTGYGGTVDLVLVRRRTKGEIASLSAEERLQPEWVNTQEKKVSAENRGTRDVTESAWYAKHPEAILGEAVYGQGKFLNQAGVKLNLESGEDFEKGLNRVLTAALEQVRGKYAPAPGAEADPALTGYGESVGRAKAETPVFGLEVKDGKVLRKGRDGELRVFRPEKTPKGKAWDVPDARFAHLVEMMEAAAQLKELMGRGAEVGFLQEQVKSLLEEWKAMPRYPRQPMDKSKAPLFPGVAVSRKTVGGREEAQSHVTTLKFGDGALEAFAGQDKRYTLLRGLYDKKLTGFNRILTERPQLKQPPVVAKGDMSTADGVVKYLLEKFGVFRDAVAREEFRGSPEDYQTQMLAHPDLNWDGEEFVHDAEYIQGDLRKKIEASKKDGLKRQVKKLEAALPVQKTAATVGTSPISTWWDSEALTAFARSQGILGGGYRVARARLGYAERFRVLQGDQVIDRLDRETFTFVEHVLNQRPIRVQDPSGAQDGTGDPLMVPDYALSKRVRDEWGQKFDAWAKSPAGRPHAERAAEKFNKDYASQAEVKENESPLFIQGLSPILDGRPIRPYASQMAVVRRIVRQHGAIVAHGVGHGKTLGAIFTHQEMRNQGLVRKPLYVAPSKNRGMWHSNITQVMPGVDVKVISSDGPQRRVDLIDAANNRYDAILMSYDTFKTIPLAKGEAYMREDIERFEDYLKELETAKRADKRLTDGMKKRIQEKIEKLKAKLLSMQMAMKDPDGVVTFEDLDVDFVFLDEGHTVKNSYEQMHEYADRPFLNSRSDSHIGNDMVYKARYIHEKRGGKGGITPLTATPTPNTPLEIYKIIKLVAPEEWTNRGINTVDDFIRDFVEIGPIEAPGLDATSSSTTMAGKQREGIIGWKNLKALRSILNTWMDFRKDNPDVKKPNALARPTYVDLNDDQLNAMARILVLAEMPREQQMRLGVNMASLTTQAKLVSVDPAFLDPSLLESKPFFLDRSPKLKKAMEVVGSHYEKHPDRLQIVYLDFFRIRDFKPLETEDGRPMPWPKGFGDLGVNEDGARVLPDWFADLDDTQREKMYQVMDGSRADYRTWPKEFFDKSGRPAKVTENTIERYRPEFDEEGNVVIKMEVVHENLHDSIEKYAVGQLGMPAHRVIVVNANRNGRPEDKTRVESMVADGLLSLIIGNKPSIGEGLNLQNGGDAMHHMDVPWTPKELEQANGRMWRPRAETEDDFPITIYNYIAKGSLDAKGYAVLDQKEKWQQGLYQGNADYMDNTLNNLDKTGFSYKEMADEAKVNPEYVAGYRLGAAVDADASSLAGAQKELERITRALEVQRNAHAEAVRKIEDAEKRIQEGESKAAAEGKPYEGGAYWQKVIDNNRPAAEAGPGLIAKAEEKLKPFEDVALHAQANARAKVLVPLAKANKWKALGGGLPADRAEAYRTMLGRTMPDIAERYPLLADMVATKAVGGTLPADMGAAEAQVMKLLQDKLKGQAGGVSPKLLGAAVGGTALAGFFGPEALAAAGALGGAVWALKRLNRIDQVKRLTWSIEGRLQGTPGWEELQPKFGQAHRLAQINIARMNHAMKTAMKGMTEEERLQVADKVENPGLRVGPRITAAAETWRRIAKATVPRLQEVGYDVMESDTYFPRVFNWERVQQMKKDPALLDREIQGLVKQGFSEEDAEGILLNMFDNTDTMKRSRAADRNRELIQAIRRRHPRSDASLLNAYKRAKNQYGEMYNGYLKQRKMPQLSPDLYVRDPERVLPDYLDRTWKNIAYRKVFGQGLADIRDFLDTNWPLLDGEASAERDQAEDFLDTELYGHRFSSVLGIKDQETAQKVARGVTTYQLWTKLFSSLLSPARNVAAAVPVSLPLAGGRDTMKGMLKALQEAPGGFEQARLAGAVTERVLKDTFETAKGNERTFFAKLGAADWHPFTVTERYVRAFAYHAGRYRAERLFRMVREGGERGALRKALGTSQDPAAELEQVLGAERFRKDLEAGSLSKASRELFGAAMAEDVGGSTRPLRLPRWANTPEGTVIGQFRRVAYDQTRTLYHRVWAPARRGHVGPLIRWAAGVGMSSSAAALLASMVNGEDEKKDKEAKTPGQKAWAFLDFVNNIHGLGLWGDLANMVKYKGVADLAGPTLSGAYKAIVDFGQESMQGEDGSFGEAARRTAKREWPLAGKLSRWGVPPFTELDAEEGRRFEIPMR